MARHKANKLGVLSINTKIKDINISEDTKALLDFWGIKTVEDLYVKGNYFFSAYRNLNLRKIEEAVSIIEFLSDLTHKEFPFENCVEHDFSIPMCKDCGIEKLLTNVPVAQIIRRCSSGLCSLNLKEIIELKRSKKHTLTEIIEINLILSRISEKCSCGSSVIKEINETENNHFKSTMDLEKHLNDVLEELDIDLSTILFYRYGIGQYDRKTLEQLGKMFNLTRERIRQKERQALNKFINKIKKDKNDIFHSIDPVYFSDRGSIMDLVIEFGVSEGKYKHIDSSTNVYVKTELFDQLTNELAEIEKAIVTSGSYSLENYIGVFDTTDIKKILEVNFRVQENTVYGKNTVASAIKVILSELEEGISLGSSTHITRLLKRLKDDFGIIKSEEVVRTGENILKGIAVQVGPRHFRDPKFVRRFDDHLMQGMYEKIAQYRTISSKELFNAFRKDLIKYKIDNPTGLYGYFRFYHPEEFDFGGTNLVISLMGHKTSWQEIIKDIIESRGEPVLGSDIQTMHPDISTIILNNSIVNDPEILSWGNGYIFLRTLIKITKSEKMTIWSFVQDEKVIRTSKLLYFIIDKFPHIQSENFIFNEETLVQFLKAVFPEMFEYKERGALIYLIEQ